VNQLLISSSDNGVGGAISPMSSILGPVDSGADKIVKPSDFNLHQEYKFYIKATAIGGANKYFGPYILNVGCFSGSVTFTDSSNFVSSVNLNFGAPTANVYTFHQPSSNRDWCTIQSNEIVTADATGTPW